MVCSAVAVNNMLSSLKPVNSSSIKAGRISSKPLEAKQSMSGQVPCLLSLGCFPAAACWAGPLRSYDSHVVKMWPFYRFIPIELFWNMNAKQLIVPNWGNCLFLPPQRRKPLSLRLMAQLKAMQWGGFGVHGPCGHAGHGQQPKAYPEMHTWLFGEVKSKDKFQYQTGKKKLTWGFSFWVRGTTRRKCIAWLFLFYF